MKYVLLAVDKNMLMQAVTTIYSLSVHVKKNEYAVIVVIAGDDETVAEARVLIKRVGVNTNLIINVQQARNTFICYQPTVEYITSATFVRLEAEYYLPTNVQRVLYVDADAIFTGNPDELFELPLDDNFVAAVHDRWVGVHVPVFNAGVMMINLNQWRIENVAKQIAERNLSNVKVSDQDVLNDIFKERWIEVNGVFNFVPGPAWKITLREFVQKYMNDRRDVRIVHFAGPDKPWQTNSTVNCRLIYEMYFKQNVDLDIQKKLLNLYTRII